MAKRPPQDRPHPRGRASRRLPERARGDPDRGEDPVDRAARRDRPEANRAHVVRPARRDPAARRRGGGDHSVRAPRGRRLLGADPEPEGARERAQVQRPLPGGELLPLRLRDPQPQERQPLDRRVPGGPRGHDRGGPRGRPALRGRDLDQLRLPLRGRGPAGACLRDRGAAGGLRLRGDRLRRHHRDGESATGGGVLRGGQASGSATSSSPRTSTTPGARGWRTSSRRSSRESTPSRAPSESWAAARCHPDRPGTSRPRTSSRCSRRWGSRPGSTWPS